MSFGVVVIIAGACGGGSTAEPAAGPNAAALPQRLPVVSSGKVPDGPLSTPSSTPALPETQPAAATPAAPARHGLARARSDARVSPDRRTREAGHTDGDL